MERQSQWIVGCLVIDDPMSGGGDLSGLLSSGGLADYPFSWTGEDALTGLQTLLQRARRERGACAILARGLGCGAALALAEQLPVERLALIDPAPALARRRRRPADPALRQARRLCAFARRNLSLCVADALVVEGAGDAGFRRLEAGGLGVHGRLARLEIGGKTGEELYTICENRLKRPITHFLRAGECPKELAENAKMCIIDG